MIIENIFFFSFNGWSTKPCQLNTVSIVATCLLIPVCESTYTGLLVLVQLVFIVQYSSKTINLNYSTMYIYAIGVDVYVPVCEMAQ